MSIKNWIKKNCDSLKNKRVVITGATGGLGRETCLYLASLGADMTLACRNKRLAENLIVEITSKFPETSVDFVELDYSSIDGVDKAITEIKKYNGVDVLINNAGVYNVPIKKMDSGFNNVFQINFVYTYYLTKKLLPELEKKENSCCITLGSVAHNYSKLDEEDIDFSTRAKASLVYGNSKRFLMFSLYEMFKDSKVNLAIVHPGVTLTNMTNHYPKYINWLVKIGIKLFFPNPKKAVLSVLYGLSNKTDYHEWIGPSIFNVWGFPKKSKLKTCSAEESKKMYLIAEDIYQNKVGKKYE